MSLVAHWRLDGSVEDSVGNNDGSASPTYVDGKLGQGIDGDGTQIRISSDNQAINSAFTGNQLTLSLWLRQYDHNTYRWNDILGMDGTRLERGRGDDGDASGDYWCNFGTGDSAISGRENNVFNDNATPDGSEWFHVVIRRKGDDYAVYINGERDTSCPVTGPMDISGDFIINESSSGSEIDDIRLYDHAISEKRIVQLSQAKVLHYKFNQDNSVVSDASGQGNTGTLNGPTFTESSKIGSGAYEFDGNGNRIVVQNSPSIDITGDEITISYWQKFKDFGNQDHPVIAKNAGTGWSATNGGYVTGHGWSNNLYSGLSGNNLGGQDANIRENGEWQHVVHRYKNGNGMKVYVDGNLEIHDTSISGTIGSTNHDLWIGDAERGGNYFGGLDDVRLYATALSASEVQEVYEQRASIDASGNFHTHEVEEPDERIIFTDSTYSVNSQKYNVLTTTTPEDTDYSEWVESDDTLGNIYLEGWVHLTNSSWYPTTFEFTKNNNNKGVYAYFQDGVDSWQQGWNYVFVKADNWSNVSNTPWSNMDRLQIYRNGADSGDSSESIRFKNIRLRKYPDNEPVDDMSLQDDGTLRTNSISEVGPASNSLVGWWKLDGDIRDHSGNGNHGTNNGANVTGGLGQSAYEFDNENSDGNPYEHIISNNVYVPKIFTLSAWIKDDNSAGVGDNIYSLGWHKLCFNGGDSDHTGMIFYKTDGNYAGPTVSNIGMDNGNWHHHCMVVDSTKQTIEIHFDGELIDTQSTGEMRDVDSYRDFVIGSAWDRNYGGWDGKIQDVRIYDRAFTSKEVNALYNLTDPRKKQQVTQNENGITMTKNQFNELL